MIFFYINQDKEYLNMFFKLKRRIIETGKRKMQIDMLKEMNPGQKGSLEEKQKRKERERG